MARSSNAERILDALTRVVASPAFVVAAGNHEERAAMLLTAICQEIDGGRPVYLPSADRAQTLLDKRRREAALRAAFDGTNYGALAHRHGITVRQVRRIVDRK